MVLSINPSANTFVFGEFDVHCKDWLTDQTIKLSYDFSISSCLMQIFLTLVNVMQWPSLYCKILIMLLSQSPLTLLQTQNRKPHFIVQLTMTILCEIGIVLMIIWEIFHGKISLNELLLWLLLNFVSGSRFEYLG